MSVESTERRIQFVGDGATVLFPFSFKVFAPTDVAVYAGETGGAEKLTYGTDYSVSLNDDQDASPGGSVTVKEAVAKGVVLAVMSEVPYDQPMHVTPYGGFNPETLNDNSDRQCIQIQQLLEKVNRAIAISPTDTMAPEELKQKLLDATESATVVAKGYAEAAQASAEAAAKSEQAALDTEGRVDDKATSLIQALEDKGTEQENRVTAEGDVQVKRLQDEAGNELILRGTACGERTWTLQEDIEADAPITIPDSLIYLVGRHHLRVSWNGLILYPAENFNEIGDLDTRSRTFSLTFPAKAGDVLDVWVGALGQGDVVEAIEAASAAQSAVAELSRKVVYKDQESAEE